MINPKTGIDSTFYGIFIAIAVAFILAFVLTIVLDKKTRRQILKSNKIINVV